MEGRRSGVDRDAGVAGTRHAMCDQRLSHRGRLGARPRGSRHPGASVRGVARRAGAERYLSCSGACPLACCHRPRHYELTAGSTPAATGHGTFPFAGRVKSFTATAPAGTYYLRLSAINSWGATSTLPSAVRVGSSYGGRTLASLLAEFTHAADRGLVTACPAPMPPHAAACIPSAMKLRLDNRMPFGDRGRADPPPLHAT
jgi:hypothetical protein